MECKNRKVKEIDGQIFCKLIKIIYIYIKIRHYMILWKYQNLKITKKNRNLGIFSSSKYINFDISIESLRKFIDNRILNNELMVVL